MYTILVTNNHELIATQRERIMQRSKLVNKMQFLVPPDYDGLDISKCTVYMEYKTPDGEIKSDLLTASKDLYKEHLEYIVPFDTELTRFPGAVEVKLNFVFVDMDADGNIIQKVRKTGCITINILPVSTWNVEVADPYLTSLDKMMVKTNILYNQAIDINNALAEAVPDDLMIENGRAYLSKDGKVMANTAGIPIEECDCEEGVPAVDFTVMAPDDTEMSPVDNVIEF